jgi:hypothetical protein
MTEYVILGTSHDIQESPEFCNRVEKDIRAMAITLVAEEFPFNISSKVCAVATTHEVPYLQIDLLPDEWQKWGIDYEMNARLGEAFQGQDIRFSHADQVREDLWLQKIEDCTGNERVLIVCGYLHSNFLADNVQARGGSVISKNTFPTCLIDRKPDKTLTLEGLREFLRKSEADGMST